MGKGDGQKAGWLRAYGKRVIFYRRVDRGFKNKGEGSDECEM